MALPLLKDTPSTRVLLVLNSQLAVHSVCTNHLSLWASLVAQTVKCLSTIWKTWVQFLGWEDPLEKEMATHSSIHAWKIPWAEEPGRLQSMGLQRVGHD